MRVVVVDDDIFAGGGGGQTFYRKLVRDHPDIEFVYFLRNEPADAIRPRNATPVTVGPEPVVQMHHPLFVPPADLLALRRALAYTAALSGQAFDLIDVPDYKLFGPYLRDALEFHGVRYGAIAHSMHGVISDSISRDWATFGAELRDLRNLELRQYCDADRRYAISPQYARDWRLRTGLGADLIDPLNVLLPRETIPLSRPGARPRLLCVGRRERRKGDDLAIEIVQWLDPGSHRGLHHVGAPSPAGEGLTSDDILREISRARGQVWQADDAISPDALFELYRDEVVVMAPVRYDTLNLTSLEAAAVGAPTVVSRHAGISDYFNDQFSAVPVLSIDPEYPETAAQAMGSWMTDYADLRRRSIEFAKRMQERIGALDLRASYGQALETAGAHARRGSPLRFSISGETVGAATRNLWGSGVRSLRELAYRHRRSPWLRRPYSLIRGGLSGVSGLTPVSLAELARLSNRLPEGARAEIKSKIATLGRMDPRAPGRCAIWSEMARLERLRGEDLRAAAYDIRAMRLSDRDPWGRMALVRETLLAEGLGDVARALEAMYSSSAVPGRISGLLADRRERLRHPFPVSADVAEIVADSREASDPVDISILVSIYNAGPKLVRFISQLSHQTAVKAGRVELILVDAASPENEAATCRQASTEGPFAGRVVYIRTSKRITIQAAWNVALQHARGRFVTALGVDETLYPRALEQLADALLARPLADWAMASSVVTEVTAGGAFTRDKMFYDRSGAQRDMTMLDTTYLSWVGGLYRRSVHDRFGYYDPDFRAAGDTEFKNRILPQLSVVFVPGTLGAFLDYPDDRASASVRAEIEDALAWYLYRTPAGAAALFARRSTAELEQIVHWCAGQRKCYRRDPSTDVELGFATSAALAARSDAPAYAAEAARLFAAMRDELRQHDFPDGRAARTPRLLAMRFAEYATALNEATGWTSALAGFNDNRFEQHSWVWGEDA